MPPVAAFSDDFNAEELDGKKWLITRKHDFKEFAVGIARSKDEKNPGRLRLRCGTIGTDDRTVKSLGVATRAPLDLAGRKRLAVDFDWNKQFNGCYLTGAIYLCPTLTLENPADEAQWLGLEYVGVPPGKKVRAAIWLRNKRTARWLYDEGWPKKQRTGRVLGRPHIEIHFEDGEWKVLEDGKPLFESRGTLESRGKWKLPFSQAHLYLQMTSHSNYPPREIFFDNVVLGPMRPAGARDGAETSARPGAETRTRPVAHGRGRRPGGSHDSARAVHEE